MVINSMYAIFSSNESYAELSIEKRMEYWQPQNLESNWNDSTEKEILKRVKKDQALALKAA